MEKLKQSIINNLPKLENLNLNGKKIINNGEEIISQNNLEKAKKQFKEAYDKSQIIDFDFSNLSFVETMNFNNHIIETYHEQPCLIAKCLTVCRKHLTTITQELIDKCEKGVYSIDEMIEFVNKTSHIKRDFILTTNDRNNKYGISFRTASQSFLNSLHRLRELFSICIKNILLDSDDKELGSDYTELERQKAENELLAMYEDEKSQQEKVNTQSKKKKKKKKKSNNQNISQKSNSQATQETQEQFEETKEEQIQNNINLKKDDEQRNDDDFDICGQNLSSRLEDKLCKNNRYKKYIENIRILLSANKDEKKFEQIQDLIKSAENYNIKITDNYETGRGNQMRIHNFILGNNGSLEAIDFCLREQNENKQNRALFSYNIKKNQLEFFGVFTKEEILSVGNSNKFYYDIFEERQDVFKLSPEKFDYQELGKPQQKIQKLESRKNKIPVIKKEEKKQKQNQVIKKIFSKKNCKTIKI